MTLTIPTRGTDIHVIERPNGGWTIQQGRSHVLVTPDEARQLSTILNNLTTAPHGGQAVGPISAKPPIIRYGNFVSSDQVLQFVNARQQTGVSDLVEQFSLSYDAAAKHLQRLHESALIRKPQHGVYSPLNGPQTDLFDGLG